MTGNVLAIATAAASVGLAVNIGANNSAAEMGPACGAGVRSRRQAVLIIAVFCIAGAVTAGGRVVHTVGRGLIGADVLANGPGALIAVLAAMALVGAANLLGLPVATSHAVVGAVVGLGLFYGTADRRLLATVVAWWVATPAAALVLSYFLGRLLYSRLPNGWDPGQMHPGASRALAWGVTLSSCWMAFSAGSNSLAKAVGPAVGAGVFSPGLGAVVGGAAMAAGALLFGGRMIQAVGKGITSLCPASAMVVQVVSASIVFTASRRGMPVSLAEIVTCAVIGFGCAAGGVRKTARNRYVRRIAAFWPAAPVAAAGIAFCSVAIGGFPR
jgi:sulfate permease